MIGRADIEGSKSNVAMNAWLPQASYPCGNFSDTPGLKLLKHQGIDRPRFHGSYSHMCSVTQHQCRRRQMFGKCSQIHPFHSLFVRSKK